MWDIIGGSKNGGVYFYKNVGVLGALNSGDAECILEPDEFVDKINGGKCGITQVAVADYNNDGKLDLVIGNNNIINKPMPESLTSDQIKEEICCKSNITKCKRSNRLHRDASNNMQR